MDRLQYLIDHAFGQPEAQRAPQGPNEFTIARERALEEKARKIDALRKARLTQPN
jgi:hypothetical protein